MATESSRVSNAMGVPVPQWIVNQLNKRSEKMREVSRDTDNILYQGNKTCFIRLISSVDITNPLDQQYFKSLGIEIKDATSLAKNFILQGGVSKFNEDTKGYDLRSGLSAYNVTNQTEIEDYGYRPMPGIQSVRVQTQGKMGSLRSADILIKVWDKTQLDIIDALYFKLGFTMFLEWGHTAFFKNGNKDNTLHWGEEYGINPFESELTKEKIFNKIYKNIVDSEGNYDAMLGMVTNFTFSYNQEGGYDCNIKLMALGVLASGIKINNPNILPELQKDIIKKLYNTLIKQAEIARNLEQKQVALEQSQDIINYPPCIRNREGVSVIPTNKKGTFQPYAAVFITTDQKGVQTQRYYYLDGTYQTTGLNSSGKWSCDGETLFIDGQNVDRLPTFDEAVKAGSEGRANRQIESSDGQIYDVLAKRGNSNYEYISIARTKSLLPVSYDKDGIEATLDVSALNNTRPFLLSNTNYDVNLSVANRTNEALGGFQGQSLPKSNVYNAADLLTGALLRKNKSVIQPSTAYITINDTKTFNFPYPLASRNLYESEISYSVGKNKYYIKLDYDYNKHHTLFTTGKNLTKEAINDVKNSEGFWEGAVEYVKSAIKFTPIFFLGRYLIDAQDQVQIQNSLIADEKFNESVTNAIKSAITNNSGNWKLKTSHIIEGGFDIFGYEATKTIFIDRAQTVNEIVGKDKNENPITNKKTINVSIPITITLFFSDLSILKNFSINDKSVIIPVDANTISKEQALQNQKDIVPPQEPASEINVEDIQTSESLKYQSAFEVLIRTIQLYSLDNAINVSNIDTIKLVSKLDITNSKHYNSFTKRLFSIGLFSSILDDLINNDKSAEEIECKNYDKTINESITQENMLKLRSKFGFNFSLMGNSCTATDLYSKDCRVDFKDLMTTYTVPYKFNSGVFDGTQMNHPVYIKLGFVLMIINHICNIYDNKKDSKSTTPLVYFDFNTNTNICLSNAKQLSTNPYDILIPFEGTNADFKELFDQSTISEKEIYKPDSEDRLSTSLPKFKLIKGTDKNIYSGKTMNILISCDYLLNMVASYVKQDGSHDIYAKEFVEQLLFDINKFLGDINIFRLAYDDYGNVLHIIDDQFTPNVEEKYITPTNKTEFPLFGAGSIARSIEIKTEVSTKLANMLAISANSEAKDLSSLSKSSDSFGFYNIGYNDRYILNRGEIKSSVALPTEAMKNSAAQFNKAIKTFYSDTTPAQSSISHATNYYIEKMSKIKTNEKGTRASAVIPVSLNFSIDGISGLGMGQSFTISSQFLPYTYDLSVRDVYGKQDRLNTVGFVAVGLDQSIEGNEWKSNIRANMIFLKKRQDFDIKNLKLIYPPEQAFVSTLPPGETPDSDITITDFTNYPSVDSGTYPNVKFASGKLGSPGSEKLNPSLLSSISAAAVNAGVTVTITTGIGGHEVNTNSGNRSRHTTGDAVDIAIIDGLAANTSNSSAKEKADKFVSQLISAGFSRNIESGNPKAVLWNIGGHYNHIHVSFRSDLA